MKNYEVEIARVTAQLQTAACSLPKIAPDNWEWGRKTAELAQAALNYARVLRNRDRQMARK